MYIFRGMHPKGYTYVKTIEMEKGKNNNSTQRIRLCYQNMLYLNQN